MAADHQSKFCVLTTGRSGSTLLMDTLEKFDDIALPNKNIHCPYNELVHPLFMKTFTKAYSDLCNTEITTASQLLDCFFQYNADSRFAGFKSMPQRRDEYNGYLDNKDFKFITLLRRDVASTISSFFLAIERRAWKQRNEESRPQWTFREEHTKRVRGIFARILRSRAELRNVPGAIHLFYEDLCDPNFHSAELDSYFERAIRIDDPKPPTMGGDYVTNWDEFTSFIETEYRRLRELSGRAGPD